MERPLSDEATIWYFAYGSNLDPDRFRFRVCDFYERRRAVLDGFALRFSGEVTSEGGGGAVIVASPGARVFGGVYRIDQEQIESMDQVELAPDKDPSQKAERRTITLQCPGGDLEAEVYVVPRPRVFAAPSAVYLDHIVSGLRAFGYDEGVIEQVTSVAAREPAQGRR